MALVTFAVGTTLALFREELSNVLSSALLVAPANAVSGFFSDARTVFGKKSFIVLLFQGAFASAGHAAMGFSIMVYQYSGFTDFQASTLVSFNAVGHAAGAIASGFLADRCAKGMPGHGRIYFGQAGSLLSLTMLVGFAVAGAEDFLNSEHYYLIATFSLLLGFFQLWAYVGAVKPILSEIVPFRLVGSTLSYAAAIDGAFASFMGAPVVGFIAESLFGYRKTDQVISEMAISLRESNRDSLCKAFLTVVTTGVGVSFCLFSLLHHVYPEDRNRALF
jgi:MFS family permease